VDPSRTDAVEGVGTRRVLRAASSPTVSAGVIEPAALSASIARVSPDVIYILDVASGSIVYINDAVRAVLGHEPAEIISLGSRAFDMLVHPVDAARARSGIGRLKQVAPGEVIETTFRVASSRGEYRLMDGRLVVFGVDDYGAVAQLLGTTRDVTEAQRSRDELRQAHAFAAAVANATPDLIYVYDLLGERVVYCNAEASALLGYTPAEVVALGPAYLTELLDPSDTERVASALAGLRGSRAADVMEVDFRIRPRGGGTRWMSGRYVVFARDPSGGATQLLATVRDVTPTRMADAALRRSEHDYQLLADHASDVITRVTPEARVVYASPATERLFGLTPAEFIAIPYISEHIHPEDLSRVVDDFQHLVSGKAASRVTSHRHLHADGRWVWIESVARPILDDQSGRLREIVMVSRDVTSRVEAGLAHDESERRFRRLFDAAPVGVAVTDLNGAILYGNAALFELVGQREQWLRGRSLLDMFDPASLESMSLLRARVLAGDIEVGRGEGKLVVRDGASRWCLVTNVRFPLDDGRLGVLSHLQDITPLVDARAELARQAMRDPLTGLANRIVVLDHLKAAIDRAKTSGGRVALIFADIDNFKRVNDSLGHAAGDELIVAVANRFRHVAPLGALVARLGGDEFVMVVDEQDGAPTAVQVSELLATAISAPMVIRGQEVVTTVSVGIAVTDGSASPESLLRDADAAMYQAKSRGRAHWVLANPRMHEAAQRELRLESELRRAIAGDELVLHYQPVVDATSKIVGAEALIRWQHPVRGIEMPAQFLDVAEASDLIVTIGDRVLEMACLEGARWQRDYPNLDLRVACNVVARQLGYQRFAAKVADLLARTGLDPRRLTIEVTESQFVEAVPTALAELEALSRLGVSVAVDDFGTGFAGLTQLKSLPAQIVKLDQSFVQGLGIDRADTAIVEAVIGLARATDRLLVAEGVETEDQWRRLQALGCPRAQGFLLYRPMTAESFRAVIDRGAGGALHVVPGSNPSRPVAERLLGPDGSAYVVSPATPPLLAT
jgi:diguanylate cyclase (GGDEF)-like protein/PAS domain S-box-containing protein